MDWFHLECYTIDECITLALHHIGCLRDARSQQALYCAGRHCGMLRDDLLIDCRLVDPEIDWTMFAIMEWLLSCQVVGLQRNNGISMFQLLPPPCRSYTTIIKDAAMQDTIHFGHLIDMRVVYREYHYVQTALPIHWKLALLLLS